MGWSNILVRAGLALAFAGLAACAVPAFAEELPRPLDVALPEEREALAALVAAVPADPGRAEQGRVLAAIDTALARLTRPTRLRGLVQLLRAETLMNLGRDSEAAEAAAESIRLLPDTGEPLLMSAYIHAYRDRPREAADLLSRAAGVAPPAVRRLPHYEVDNVLIRLDSRGEQAVAAKLSESLLAIGWTGSNPTTNSSLAMYAIGGRTAAGDLDGARALLPRLESPIHVQTLLIDREFERLWPDIERIAGPRMERLWATFLPRLRSLWLASGNPEDAYPYARALDQAGHYRTVIRELLPLFAAPDRERDEPIVMIAPVIASALSREGRWEEIDAMFARGLALWPLGGHARALNLSTNRASRKLFRGDAEAAVAGMDESIADAARWGGEASAAVMAQMHQTRACALHQLGRDAAAASSVALVLAQRSSPATIAELHLCLGRTAAARDVLIAALEDRALRHQTLRYVQPIGTAPPQGEYGALARRRRDALAADPLLLAAVSKYGRILPFALSDGAIEAIPR